jgi:hypothetical protein
MANHSRLLLLLCSFGLSSAFAQELPVAEPGQLAFEQGRWEDAIREYHELLDEYPEDRLSWLRIAQAERELGRYEAALASLELAAGNDAPEAAVYVERARNLLGLGRTNEALAELETADHLELRARALLEESPDFDPLRGQARFERIYSSVRRRVYPCENTPEAGDFDFWLGDWEVRGPDGSLLGQNSITRDIGGCVLRESWRGTPGSTGSSMSFYLPSRGQWRHVWIGSSGTHIDMTGGIVDGAMRMEGTIEYLDQDQVIAFRATWSKGANGVVRQRMEQFNLVGRSWDLWFDGVYRRVD